MLGPAKFTLEELPSDEVFKQDPLGSIAVNPNTYFAASPNENHIEAVNVQDTSDNMLSGQHMEVEDQVSDNGNALNGFQVGVIDKEFNEAYENGNVISGSHIDEANQKPVEVLSNGNFTHNSQVDDTNKESVEASSPDFQVKECLATPEDVMRNSVIPVTNLSPVTADVVVETFPLRSVTSTVVGIGGSEEFKGIINSQENETKNLDLKRKEKSELEGVELMKHSNVLDEKSVDDLGNTSGSGNEDEGKNVGHTLVESTMKSALKEHVAHDNETCADPQVKAPHRSNILTAEVIELSQTTSDAEVSLSKF